MDDNEPSNDREPSGEDLHTARMRRKKAVMDRKIGDAQRDRGVLVVNTGPGKGKSSSGFGMIARALGHGMRAGIVQFLKGRSDTGEFAFFRRFPEEVRFHVMGEGFTWETQDRARDVAMAQAAWDRAREFLRDPAIDFVLLDEMAVALRHEYLRVDSILADLRARPAHQHVVVTGRGAPPELIAAADTVTEMKLIKHAFSAGVRAQKGVEW